MSIQSPGSLGGTPVQYIRIGLSAPETLRRVTSASASISQSMRSLTRFVKQMEQSLASFAEALIRMQERSIGTQRVSMWADFCSTTPQISAEQWSCVREHWTQWRSGMRVWTPSLSTALGSRLIKSTWLTRSILSTSTPPLITMTQAMALIVRWSRPCLTDSCLGSPGLLPGVRTWTKSVRTDCGAWYRLCLHTRECPV